jgi:hypothetical protein
LRDEVWSIAPDDPLSMAGTSVWTCDMHRGDWFVRTVTISKIRCTKTDWQITGTVIAYEAEQQIFEKVFETVIPRDLM